MPQVICSRCGSKIERPAPVNGVISFICQTCDSAANAPAQPPTKTKKGGLPHALRVRGDEAAKAKTVAKQPRA